MSGRIAASCRAGTQLAWSSMAQADAATADQAGMPAELSTHHLRRRLLELAVFAVLVAAAVSALPGLGSVRDRFVHIDPGYLFLIAALELASALSYVVVFRDVFCRRLSWRFSYQLGMAEQGTNVLLPTGGAGGLALGAWALRQGGMPTEYIGRRSVAFFLITSTPNFVCAAVLGALMFAGVIPSRGPAAVSGAIAALAIVVMGLTAALPHLLSRIEPRDHDEGARPARLVRRGAVTLARGVGDTGVMLRSGRPQTIGGSIAYLALDIAALGAAFAAFGGVPALGPFVFAYVVGQLGGLIPLPGGIGGTDGGLIGALVLYGSPVSQAAAAVLVYRAFQLGLPSLLGAAAFLRLRGELSGASAPAAICAPLAEPLGVVEAPRAGVA